MRLLLAALLLIATQAAAQDRSGRDTPGEWVVDHHQSFGLWDSMCDNRTSGDTSEARCYLRYVDVFSPRPKFAAQFLFLTPGPNIDFGVERGTRFLDSGFRIEQDGTEIWSTDRKTCLRGRECTFDATDAETLLQAMRQGDSFAFDFTDRHGQPQSLRWDLTPFAAAYDDFRAQTEQRGF